MNSSNKKIEKNIEKYLKWVKENFPKYEVKEVNFKHKYIQLVYSVKAIWTSKYYILINFNDEWDIIKSSEDIEKFVWNYNRSINKENLNDYRNEEDKTNDNIIENYKKSEKNRTTIEKYKTKKIALIAWIPALIMLIFIWYMIYIAIVDWKIDEDLKELALYLFSPVFLWFMVIWFVDDWDKKLEAKRELSYEWKLKYDIYEYESDFFYTDSLFAYILYNLVKVTFFLITFWILGFFAILLFNGLWSISIAPTTIIIILLLIIIYNQNRKS